MAAGWLPVKKEGRAISLLTRDLSWPESRDDDEKRAKGRERRGEPRRKLDKVSLRSLALLLAAKPKGTLCSEMLGSTLLLGFMRCILV